MLNELEENMFEYYMSLNYEMKLSRMKTRAASLYIFLSCPGV